MLGLCSTSLGDIREGVRAYERAVELNPRFKEAWVNMGQVSLLSRWRRLASSLGHLLRRSQRAHAQALKEEGRTQEAERALLKALQLDPPDQPSVNVIRILAQVGRVPGVAPFAGAL